MNREGKLSFARDTFNTYLPRYIHNRRNIKSTSNGHSEILFLKVGCVDRTKHSYVYIVIIDDYRYFGRVNVRRSIVTNGNLHLVSHDEAENRKNRGQRTEDRGRRHGARSGSGDRWRSPRMLGFPRAVI